MSLKSFDENAENPLFQSDEDEAFDERQDRVRDKITIKAANFFVRLGFVNIVIMERVQWCESYLLSSCLILSIALVYWHIRNGINGSLFGMDGVRKRVGEATAALLLVLFAVLITVAVFTLDVSDVTEHFFIRDGMVSNYIMSVVVLVLSMADSVTIYVLALRHKLKEKSAGE